MVDHGPARVESLEHDIWRIDTAYLEPGVAACYLMRGGDDYALIECGTGLSVKPILQALEQLAVPEERVRMVIPTHVHLDHAGGAGGLMRALPQASLYVHQRGARHLIDPGRLVAGAQAVYGADVFRRENGEIVPAPPDRTHACVDGQKLLLGDRPLLLRDAPGHAKHHLVVWDERSQGFFSGDVFGLCYPPLEAAGRPFIVPTTTPVQFDPQAWSATLEMLDSYAPDRMYLTHYGCVPYDARLKAELAAAIAEHAELGRRLHASGEQALAARLEELSFQRYRGQGGALARQDFAAILAMDLRLNAQGLIVWQQH